MTDHETLALQTTSTVCPTNHVGLVRRTSMETYMVRIYPGPLYNCDYTSVEAEKCTVAADILKVAVKKLQLGNPDKYELAEVLSSGGQLCKERRLEPMENPVRIMLLWPKMAGGNVPAYKFFLRRKDNESVNRTSSWREISSDSSRVDSFLMTFLRQPTNNKEYPDLCNLPDLNEMTLLDNIRNRFQHSHIYTYVGSILIAVNPFKFFPIYNPKYVKMYQNKRLGELPPHIFAIADAAFYTMLRKKKNQCIVISGESGSGKTESTNLLLHHLTALSQKGSHGSGVEQTILGAGPVLEVSFQVMQLYNLFLNFVISEDRRPPKSNHNREINPMFCHTCSHQPWDAFVFNCIYDIGTNFVSVKSGHPMWHVSLDDIVVILRKFQEVSVYFLCSLPSLLYYH